MGKGVRVTQVETEVSSENEASGLRGTADPAEPRTILNSTLEEQSREQRSGSSQVEDQVENENEERCDGEEEYEGEDEEEEQDEYEDELRAMAESHEAMSKDDKSTGSNSSSAVRTSAKDQDKLKMMKMFESREKSVEDGSDETEASNEAIDESILKEKDVEVVQLLKYKNMHRAEEALEKRVEQKMKRVPTVKKELSTQKEINSGNETETEKRLDTKDIFHQMNDELKKSYHISSEPSTYVKEESQDKSTESTSKKIYHEKPVLQTKIREDTKFEDLESSSEAPRKVDKRQETVLRDLEAYLRAEYAAEQKQEEQKLQELGAQEGALAESLLKLLVKLAENPRRWERVHRLLMDVEGGLELSRRALEAQKRGFDLNTMISTSTSTTTISPMSSTPKKNRKKLKKKKKKKPRQHRYPISTTAIASTPSLLTTTETPWLTTPMEWRLVAERLIGPPWLWNLQDDPNVAKVRFSSNPRLKPSPAREFGQQILDSKQREEHKALNTERQALMLESAREYTQPRHLHYGKVNTHQTLVPHRESVSGYATERENSRIRDYDPPERSYQRYGQYSPPREFSRGRSREEEFIPPESYAQNHEYRPPGLEYAASKSWQDTAQFKYGRPSWKTDDRSVESGKWGWRDSGDLKLWPQVDDSRPWQSNRDYWPHLEADPDKTRSPQRGHTEQQPWETVAGVANSWPGKPSSPWPTTDKNKGYYREESSWDKGRNRSELSRDAVKQNKDKDKGLAPKVTMKSWNSLTSDPATWPFKLPGTKPWPKDKNGKSYNPNADLVRKLGLDKQGRLLSDKESTSDFKSYQPSNAKYKAVKISKDVAPKVQDSLKQPVSWPLKMTPGKQWPIKPSKDYNPDVDLVKALTLEDNPRSWTGNVDNSRKGWQEKSAISPKIQSVGAWVMPADQSTWKPYNLKALDSYNRDIEDAGRRWPTSVSESQGTWPSKSEDGPWPSKITENWNNFGKSSPPGTWPKWKQFAYHRVTAMPVMNTGSSMDGSRSRNAFIAMSAVSPKYNGNQWRKNDIEETPAQQSITGSTDPDHPSSQLRAGIEPAIYTWKKDGASIKRNSTDALEDQLEELRRAASWSHTENVNNIKKQLNAISDASVSLVSHLASSVPSNSSSGSHADRLVTEMKNRINLQTNQGQEDKELSKK
ncbi:uncharacterized protein LOC107269040 isoform X1 [Cephus cinctus]|uniref:Uncharacterized protein LOC107269040 isoform X1 n=1 Tax=Cephus cinctus TaxID=211228 RepID=A0AAJ7FLN2_CEPCN|nr:uncharacterized protein LOC107269040 isoform X1 [Cephus cinctus]